MYTLISIGTLVLAVVSEPAREATVATKSKNSSSAAREAAIVVNGLHRAQGQGRRG